jgi:FkbM family methyltransferase
MRLSHVFHPFRTKRQVERSLACWDAAEDVFITQQYNWLASRLKANTTVIDLGANMGDTAIYFAQFKESTVVMAYEPGPVPYKMMLENLGKCSIGAKVRPYNYAIGEKEGTLLLKDKLHTRSSSAEAMVAAKGTPVKVVTLSSVLDGLTNVVIKCDIEGAEETIFDGVDLSMAYAIQLEWHSQKAKEKAVNNLTEAGFTLDYIKQDTESHTGMIGAYK